MEARREEMWCTAAPPPRWKLYDNPFYDHRRRHRRRSGTDEKTSPLIEKLKAELELEKKLRKKALEELAEERMRRQAKEKAYEELAAEIARRKEEIEEAAAASPLSMGVAQRRSCSARKGSPENPHIRRGMKGFVEFPRGRKIGTWARENEDEAAKVDCQLAQLRVLLKGRTNGSASTRLDALLV